MPLIHEVYRVRLVSWRHHRVTAGDTIDRWSLVYEGRYVLTFDTELEARRAARQHGWVVETGDTDELH